MICANGLHFIIGNIYLWKMWWRLLYPSGFGQAQRRKTFGKSSINKQLAFNQFYTERFANSVWELKMRAQLHTHLLYKIVVKADWQANWS